MKKLQEDIEVCYRAFSAQQLSPWDFENFLAMEHQQLYQSLAGLWVFMYVCMYVGTFMYVWCVCTHSPAADAFMTVCV